MLRNNNRKPTTGERIKTTIKKAGTATLEFIECVGEACLAYNEEKRCAEEHIRELELELARARREYRYRYGREV